MVSISSPANPSVYGQPLQFSTTVSTVLPGVGTPTGSVQFSVDGSPLGSSQSLDASGSSISQSIASLTPGPHTVEVDYTNSDGNYSASTSQIIQVVDKDPTTTSVTSTSSTSVFGQPVTWASTVAANAPGAGIPSGTVNFSIAGTESDSTPFSQDYQMVNLDGSAAASANPDPSLQPGTYTITATYSGDSFFVGSTQTLTQTVLPDSTSTTVTSVPNPSVFGQSSTFTATVAALSPGAGTPSTTVSFYDGTTLIGTSPLNQVAGDDQATITTSALSTGSHAISAVYNGEKDFVTSTGIMTQTVNPDPSTTTLAANGPIVQGQPVDFIASVAANTPGGGTPTGTIQFFLNGSPFGTPVILDANSQATSQSTSSLTPGTYTIVGVYSGDVNFLTSTGSVGQPVIVSGTQTSLVVSPVPVIYSQNVTLTSTVTPTGEGAGTPTGSIFFYDGSNLIGSVPLAGGTASMSTSALAVGHHRFSAVYTGEYDFSSSTSSTVIETVNLIPTTTVLSASPNPSSYSQPVTLTATVAPVAPETGNPSGTVTFSNGATVLGTAPLVAGPGGDKATLTLASLPVGSDQLTASYAGDPSYAASGTTHATVQAVGAATTTMFAAAATASGVVSATLTTAFGPLANQTINFAAGTHFLCAAVTNSAGTATCTGNFTYILLNNGYTAAFVATTDYKASSATGAA